MSRYVVCKKLRIIAPPGVSLKYLGLAGSSWRLLPIPGEVLFVLYGCALKPFFGSVCALTTDIIYLFSFCAYGTSDSWAYLYSKQKHSPKYRVVIRSAGNCTGAIIAISGFRCLLKVAQQKPLRLFFLFF